MKDQRRREGRGCCHGVAVHTEESQIAELVRPFQNNPHLYSQVFTNECNYTSRYIDHVRSTDTILSRLITSLCKVRTSVKCFASLAYGSGGISTLDDAANLCAVVCVPPVELVLSTTSASPFPVEVWLSLGAMLRLPIDGD